jgi:hypothetical protein
MSSNDCEERKYPEQRATEERKYPEYGRYNQYTQQPVLKTCTNHTKKDESVKINGNRFLEAQKQYQNKFPSNVKEVAVQPKVSQPKQKTQCNIKCLDCLEALSRLKYKMYLYKFINRSQEDIVWEKQIHVPNESLARIKQQIKSIEAGKCAHI